MAKRALVPSADLLFLEEEAKAERSVALMRILIALVLATIFVVVVPAVGPSEQTVALRQWLVAGLTMGGYLLLGLVSYEICRRGHYRPRLAWIAVSGDVLFLLANVWFSLDNTGLPATHIVSIPPIWLVPVVMAFGALRFNARLQIYVIVLLVAGFVAMGVWDQFRVPDNPVPRQQVMDLFFATPPNIIRLAMMVLAGIVLAMAARRARVLLDRAIREMQRGINLTRYLPEQIADRLADGGLDALREGHRQDVAVMFVDIRDFTRQAEAMTPEVLSAFVTEFRHRLARAVDANRGLIDKFIGDGAMIVFGLADDGRNHSADALHCAKAILSEMAAWAETRRQDGLEPVRIGIGIHRGPAFCGAVGDESRLEYTVLGDTVNVAARLEELTKTAGCPLVASGEVIADAGAAGGETAWHSVDTSTLRGRSGAVSAFGCDDGSASL